MNKHLTDEQLVDWIEGNIDDDEIQSHLDQCEQCQASYQSWKELLSSDEKLNEVDRRRVWHGVVNKRQEMEYRHVKRRKQWMYTGWIASCLAFLLIGYMFGLNGGGQNYAGETTEQDHLEQFMNQPVKHYDMVSSENGESQGFAWYNPVNRQMILYLDDPRNIREQSQQIQIETLNRVISVQPNHLKNGKMQIYLRNRELHDLLQLIVSNEDNAEQQRYFFKVNTK